MIRTSMQNKLVALLGVLVLAGCQTAPPRQEEVVVVPPRYSQNVPIPKIQPTELKDIKWRIMNRATMQSFLDSTKGKEDFVIYTLDDENVAILLGNTQELRRYIQSQHEVIEYLKKVLDARTKKENE